MSETTPEPTAPKPLAEWSLESVFDNWAIWKQRQAEAQNFERVLRSEVVKRLFPGDLKEGANNVEFMLHGVERKLTVTHPVERKVDEPLLLATQDEVQAQREAVKLGMVGPEETQHPLYDVNFDKLVRKKPELATTEYRNLTDLQRTYFDTVLKIKDGSDQVELKPLKVS